MLNVLSVFDALFRAYQFETLDSSLQKAIPELVIYTHSSFKEMSILHLFIARDVLIQCSLPLHARFQTRPFGKAMQHFKFQMLFLKITNGAFTEFNTPDLSSRGFE